MATVILGALVSQAGLTGVGLFVTTLAAAVAGAYIDNEIFGPDAPKNQDEKRPHLPQQQNTSEGGPALYVLGREAVVQGQIIWMSDIDDNAGDPFVHAAVAFAAHSVRGVRRAFSRDIDIFEDANEELVVSTTLTLEQLGQGSSTEKLYDRILMKEASTGDLDMTQRKFGRKNTWDMRGLTTPPWWTESGSYPPFFDPLDPTRLLSPEDQRGTCMDTFTLSGGITVAEIRRQIMVCIFRGVTQGTVCYPFTPRELNRQFTPSNPVTIRQTFNKNNEAIVDAVVIHQGFRTQALSALIVAQQQDPNTPAWTEVAYMDLERFRIRDFGRSFPPDMQIVVDESGSQRFIEDALQILIKQYHQSPIDFTSDLDTRTLRGYGIRGNLSIAKTLEPLMMAFDFGAQMERGVLRFYHPKNANVYNIPDTDFLEPLTFQRLGDQNLPSSVTVQFTDAGAFRYEVGAVEQHVTFQRSNDQRRASNVTTVDLRMLTLTEDEARRIAKRLLWRPRLQRTRVIGRLPMHHLYLNEGDVIQTTGSVSHFADDEIEIMLTKLHRGANGVIEIEGYQRERLALELLA